MQLSVVIPAYNEEKRLPKTLSEIDKYLRQQPYQYEIIVVNDGSKDKTAQVVKEMQSQVANLRLVDNKENHGKGWVTRQGLLAGQGDFRVFTDADNSTPISEVEKMWPFFKSGYDLVIGSRDVKGAQVVNSQPWHRVLVGNIFNLMIQFLLGLWGIWDTQCGFKGFSAKAVAGILPKCRINRWAFDPEILVIAKKTGYKIKEVPVIWVNDPNSKVKLRSTIKMALDLYQIKWNLISGKYK